MCWYREAKNARWFSSFYCAELPVRFPSAGTKRIYCLGRTSGVQKHPSGRSKTKFQRRRWLPKYFSRRVWSDVASIAFILAVGSTLMLDGCSVGRPGSSAAARTLVSRVVASSFGPYRLIDPSIPYFPYLAREANRSLSRIVFDSNGNSYVINAFLRGGTSPRRVTITTLASSATSVDSGDSVTFTAKVTPASRAGKPAGTLTFFDDTTKLGSPTLNGSGIAKLTTTALPIGAHSITAAYSGDRNFAPSTSAAVVVSVAGMGGLPAAIRWTSGFAR